MQRVLEPEVMDSWEEAVAYDAMDFTEVNAAFAQKSIALAPKVAKVLDLGTGTARIPLILSQQRPQWQIIAIDLAENMLKIGAEHIKKAGLQKQIILQLVDAKQLPYPNEHFDLVISNSLFHHLPDPLPFLQQINRVLKPKGALLIRDLIRPANQENLHTLVESIGTEYDAHQKQLFADSLHAAFTIDEVNQLISQAGLQDVKIYQSSDRHWTAERSFG